MSKVKNLQVEIKSYFRGLQAQLMRLLVFILMLLFMFSCKSTRSTKVVKPKTHKIWAKGNKYLIDIPVGVRHIHLFKRRRIKTVRMN
ncbi:MAG: hypothetical protein JST48_14195 [Bacteroidetes bacterium]|nr:hypothetical protein [Bacteroidota bacterium]